MSLYILTRIKYRKKGQMNDMQLDFKFEAGNNKKYKVDGI